jgi:hypothetical protein
MSTQLITKRCRCHILSSVLRALWNDMVNVTKRLATLAILLAAAALAEEPNILRRCQCFPSVSSHPQSPTA